MLNGYIQGLSYAARIDGEVLACEFYCDGHGGPPRGDATLYWRYYAHFAYLALNVEEMFVTGQAIYPVERVLLTSGVLEAALDCRYQASGLKLPDKISQSPDRNICGDRMATPWLQDVRYRSYVVRPWRPIGTRPSGSFLTEPDDRAPPLKTMARM